MPVFGKLITDPIETVQAIGAPFAILLGGLTFVTATVGINIVANFIAPAFDFSNVAPRKISWRAGGMIAAVGSVLLTPWNWYGNDQAILYTLGVLGALIGPLFGILIAGYYIVGKQRVAVDDMYSMEPHRPVLVPRRLQPERRLDPGRRRRRSRSPRRWCLPSSALGGLLPWLGNYSWFIGCGLGLVVFWLSSAAAPDARARRATDETVDDGAAGPEADPMRIRVVNPNTTASMTRAIGRSPPARSPRLAP